MRQGYDYAARVIKPALTIPAVISSSNSELAITHFLRLSSIDEVIPTVFEAQDAAPWS